MPLIITLRLMAASNQRYLKKLPRKRYLKVPVASSCHNTTPSLTDISIGPPLLAFIDTVAMVSLLYTYNKNH